MKHAAVAYLLFTVVCFWD